MGAGTATGLSMGLAGCFGDSGNGTEGGTTETEGSDGNDGGTETQSSDSNDGGSDDKFGGTLNVTLQDEWTTLFPFKHARHPSAIQESQVAPRLAVFDYEAGETVPGAAESWEFVEGDGRQLRVKIKEGLKFHKGYGEATADDLVWTINSILEEGFGGGWVKKFMWPTPPIQRAEKVDKYQFDIISEDPFVPMVTGLLTNTRIISKAGVEDLGDDQFAKTPVSVGPYEVVSAQIGSQATMKKFEDGHPAEDLGYAGPGYADEIVFTVSPDASARLELLRSGDSDLLTIAPYNEISRLESNNKYTMKKRLGWNFDWLYVGGAKGRKPQREALNDKKVRQAIAYAVDRTSYAENAYFGEASPDDDPFVPSLEKNLVDHVDGQDTHEYDIFPLKQNASKAKSLLEEAGWSDLEVELTHKNTSIHSRAAQVLKGSIEESGITVTLNQVDDPTHANLEREGKYDLLLSDISLLSPDFEQAVNYYMGDPVGDLNSMGYLNPDVDQMIRQSRMETDPKKRDAIFRDLFEVAVEDAPWVYLAHKQNPRTLGEGVHMDRDNFAPQAQFLDLTDVYKTS
ncbi:MAG: ABC transporter substrate-binding protein [Haloplanus sp.]